MKTLEQLFEELENAVLDKELSEVVFYTVMKVWGNEVKSYLRKYRELILRAEIKEVK